MQNPWRMWRLRRAAIRKGDWIYFPNGVIRHVDVTQEDIDLAFPIVGEAVAKWKGPVSTVIDTNKYPLDPEQI